jgi:dynein heavy chain
MCDSNIPKFLKDDLVLFKALIVDLFPEANIKEVDYGDLEKVANTILRKKNL